MQGSEQDTVRTVTADSNHAATFTWRIGLRPSVRIALRPTLDARGY